MPSADPFMISAGLPRGGDEGALTVAEEPAEDASFTLLCRYDCLDDLGGKGSFLK